MFLSTTEIQLLYLTDPSNLPEPYSIYAGSLIPVYTLGTTHPRPSHAGTLGTEKKF